MAVAKVVVVVALLLCLAGMAGACIPPPKSASMPRSAAPPVVVFPAAPTPRPVVDWRARGAVTAPMNQGSLRTYLHVFDALYYIASFLPSFWLILLLCE